MLIDEERRKKEARGKRRRPKLVKCMEPSKYPHERQFEYTPTGWAVPDSFTRTTRVQHLTAGSYRPFPYRMPGRFAAVTGADLQH